MVRRRSRKIKGGINCQNIVQKINQELPNQEDKSTCKEYGVLYDDPIIAVSKNAIIPAVPAVSKNAEPKWDPSIKLSTNRGGRTHRRKKRHNKSRKSRKHGK